MARQSLELQPEVAVLYLQQLLSLGLVRVPLSSCDDAADADVAVHDAEGGEGGGGGGGGEGREGRQEGRFAPQGECLQVSLESFLQLEEEDHAIRLEEKTPSDERVQIVHKLLLDLLNTALHQEALSLHRARVPRVGGEVSAISGGAGAATGVGGGLGASGVLGASGGNVSGVSRGALPLGTYHALPDSEAELQRMVDAAVQQVLRWLVQANASDGMPIEVQLSCLLDQDAADVERGWQETAGAKEQLMAESADEILAALIDECADEMGAIMARPVHEGK